MSRRFAGLASATAVVVSILPAHAVDRAAVQPGHGGMETLRCEYAAAAVPEFGGAYLEERQTDGALVLHVWLTDVDAVDDALTALRERCPDHENVVVREADYSYAQLDDWQTMARTVDAVTVTRADTRTNRLTVGVADVAADGKAVQDALAQRGVPVDAVVLIEMSEPRTLLPPVDHSRSIALAAAVVVTVAGVAGVFWLRRLRRATRVR